MRTLKELIIITIIFIIVDVVGLIILIDNNDYISVPEKQKVIPCEEYCVYPGDISKEDYEDAIEYLKKYEGFRSNIYYDVNGARTIGYGHQLLRNDTFTTLTKKEADKLLRKDLDIRIEKIRQQHKLTGKKLLSISLLGFNVGLTKLNNYIKHDNLLNDINSILNYNKYKKGDSVYYSNRLYERRLYEYKLFKNANR